MGKKFFLIIVALLFFYTAVGLQTTSSDSSTDVALTSSKSEITNSLPGKWRPFSDDSLWNVPVSKDAISHPDSDKIIYLMSKKATNIRLAQIYSIPLWVIDSDKIPKVKMRSRRIFDKWDSDRDGWSDVAVPVIREMWPEPTNDGHLCIIDPLKMTAWEFSRFKWPKNKSTPQCTTFNIWDLNGTGMGNPFEGKRWQTRGGRGSGFPIIAGLIRPEELEAGEIRHALVFTYPKNRRDISGGNIFLPPACRSDGKHKGDEFPIEGMRFQLDPALSEKDFDKWGLNREGKIVAIALQRYGMYLGDNGGAMALQAQLLGPSKRENRAEWEKRFPGFYRNIKRIPTKRLRIVYTGAPIVKK